jgi:hypothetical protein
MPGTTAGGLPFPIVGDPCASWPETNEDLANAVEAHRGVMTASASQTLSTGVPEVYDFDASSDVIGLTVDLSANTFTTTRPGFYMIFAGSEYEADNLGRRILLLMLDGVEKIRQNTSPGGGTPGHTLAWAGPLDTGTVIRLDVFQDSGGDVDTAAGFGYLAVAQVT